MLRPRGDGTKGMRWLLATALALIATWTSACGPGAGCPQGQAQLCVSQGDCRCGAICTSNADCNGRDLCVPTSNPRIGGICADPVWALPNAPCVPWCTSSQICVRWGSMPNSCAERCTQQSDCASRCCITLSDGATKVCASERICQQSCTTPCAADETCVAFGSRPECAKNCRFDEDCPSTSCCIGLEGGGGVCPARGDFCPPAPPPVCRVFDACVQTEVSLIPASEGGCGTFGQYEGIVRNVCGEPAYCLACWFDPRTNAYSDCLDLGLVRNNVTVPAGQGRCADAAMMSMPFRVRCVDQNGIRDGANCLGNGPL
ncbi:MAG: hypothetical protein U0269_19075 [Polyangiales bacterium]